MCGDSALILKKGYSRWRMSKSPSKGEHWVSTCVRGGEADGAVFHRASTHSPYEQREALASHSAAQGLRVWTVTGHLFPLRESYREEEEGRAHHNEGRLTGLQLP